MSDILDNQKEKNFYSLFLNEETSRYIYRVVALKEIYNHPVKYGFYLRSDDFYPVIPTFSIEIDTPIHNLPSFALKNKVTYKVLRDFNPWLRRYSLPTGLKNPTRSFFQRGSTEYEFFENTCPSDTYFHDTLKINDDTVGIEIPETRCGR